MVIDVTEQDFEREVIERSQRGPGRRRLLGRVVRAVPALGPVLEQAAADREGEVVLAKLDTDANQRSPAPSRSSASRRSRRSRTAASCRVRRRPAAGRGSRAFFDALVPTEAERLVAAGGEDDLRRALELEPARTEAAVALARLLAARGERDEALAVARRAARLRRRGPRRPAAPGGDDPAVAEAFARLDAGDTRPALDALIGAIAARGDQDRKDDLRRAVVGILDELGVEHPVARESRRKLAAALY